MKPVPRGPEGWSSVLRIARPILLLAMTIALAGAPKAQAQAHEKGAGAKPGVRDHVNLFSADAIKKADAILDAVHEKTHWQGVIETVESLEGKTPRDAALTFAKAHKVHGVYVLIAKKETKIEVESSNTAKAAFSHEANQAIVEAFVKSFKGKQFDQGLLDAVELIRKDAESKPDHATPPQTPAASATANPLPAPSTPTPAPTPATTPKPPAAVANEPAAQHVPEVAAEGGGGMILLVIAGLGILLMLWAISRVFKRPQDVPGGFANSSPMPNQFGPNPNVSPNPSPRTMAPPPGYPPAGSYPPPPGPGGYGYGPPPPAGYGYGPPPQQAGGGFMQGALGGLGGAVLGNVLYDKFGHPHHDPGPGPGAYPQQDFSHEQAGALPPTQDVAPGAWPGAPTYAEPSQPEPVESYDPGNAAGGDWGSGADAVQDQGSGQDQGASGDWGAPDDQGGGDWGSTDSGSDPDPNQGNSADW